MNKARTAKLSLRKLFIAMLAAAPVAILPSPLLAVVPAGSTAPFTHTNGSGATYFGSGTTATITVPNNAILVWNQGAFNIAVGETFSFLLPTGGAVLNKVGYAVANPAGTPVPFVRDDAIINGTLSSTGRVFVLANGNISVGSGAAINTIGGLFLSTIAEPSDQFSGNLTFNGTANGNITIGSTGATAVSVTGGIGAWGNVVAVNNITVSGDMILNQRAANTTLSVTGANGPTTVSGNFTAVSNNGTINQGTGAITVSGNTSLTTNGNVSINLATNVANDFNTVSVSAGTAAGGDVNLTDATGIVLGASTVGGTLQVTSGGNLTTSGTVAVTGNATLVATNDITFANNSTVAGAAGITANATTHGSITINTVGNLVTGNLSARAGSPSVPVINVTSTGIVTINGAISGNASSNVTVTAPSINSTTTGNIGTTGGALAAVTLNGTAGNVVIPTVTANTITVTSTSGNISQSGILTSGGNVTANAGTGNITLTSANALSGARVQLTGNSAALTNTQNVTIAGSNLTGNLTVNTTGAAANAGHVTFGAGGGTASLGVTVGGNVTVNTNGGNVTQDSSSAMLVGGAVNITTTGTNLGLLTLPVTTNGTGFTSAPTVTISGGGGTGATASVTYNATTGNVTGLTITNVGVGYTGTPTLTFSTPGTAPVIGAPTFGTAGNVSFTAASAGEGGSGRFGQFNVTSNTVNLQENTTLNLGNITANAVTANSTAADILITGTVSAATLNARASSGAISESGNGLLTLSGASTFNSSNSFGTNLSNSGNTFGGNITVINGGTNIIVASSNVTFTPGNVTGGSVTINTVGATSNQVVYTGGNATDIRINSAGPVLIGGNALVRNLTINTTDSSTNSIRYSGSSRLTANGTVTLTTAGGVTLNNVTNNITGSVILANVVGNSTIYSSRNLTISGNSTGVVTAVAGTAGGDQTFSNPWNLFLGNVNFAGLNAGAHNGATTLTSGLQSNGNTTVGGAVAEGSSGNITQLSGTRLHVENTADFVTFNGNIVIGNNGNNVGRVQASTGGGSGLAGSGNITYVEDATAKIGNIHTSANATLTSRFGSIIEDPAAAVSINVGGTLSLNAPNGSIQLGDTTHTVGNTTGNVVAVTANTSGSAQVFSSGNIALGSIAANSLTVTATGNITQTAPLRIFGSSTFNSGTGITLSDTGNNFGPVSLSVTGVNQNITVTEGGTLNLRTVAFPTTSGNGTFTATSVNGDIIDTGLTGVVIGGRATAMGTGVVTLNATNGNIIIDDLNTDFPTTAGVVFNARNVTLSVLGSGNQTLVLGAPNVTSTVSGNLFVSSTLGHIGNGGNVTVSNNATFQTGNGNINLNQSGNRFGAIRFTGNQVSIQQVNDMNIIRGSQATGPAQLTSTASYITIAPEGSGTVNFGNTVTLTAGTSITLPKLIQAVGTLTVSAPETKDLSALSLTGDLNGRSPVNLGGPDYRAPQP